MSFVTTSWLTSPEESHSRCKLQCNAMSLNRASDIHRLYGRRFKLCIIPECLMLSGAVYRQIARLLVTLV